MVAIGLPQPANPLKSVLVTDVTTERVTGIRRVRDQATLAHDGRGLTDQAQLRITWMQFEVLHGGRIIRGMSDTPRLDRLRACLQAALEPDLLDIRDDSALHAGHAGAREGGHFHVVIRSARFVGLAPLARHRLVYAAVGSLMGRDIHALSIDARLPS